MLVPWRRKVHRSWIRYAVLGCVGAVERHSYNVVIYFDAVLVPTEDDRVLRGDKISGRRCWKASYFARITRIADGIDRTRPVDRHAGCRLAGTGIVDLNLEPGVDGRPCWIRERRSVGRQDAIGISEANKNAAVRLHHSDKEL